MRHPDERQIALYAGGDTGRVDRFRIGLHCDRCAACQGKAEAYRRDREAVRRQSAELPAGLSWDRMAAEMKANIRVGLAAGECVGEAHGRALRAPWRLVLASTGLIALLTASWFLKFPAEQREGLAQLAHRMWRHTSADVRNGIELEATRNGIQVSEGGSALTLMHPGSELPVVVVSTRGSLRARYIDADTGQVTITNVYAK